ncbi:hypothetical protein [Nocardia carnea]|uniref:hypothetical protein n=1 Tax=Nocardia carnea TaxID=37328 RepID=UPI002454F3EB|nr:hypothetical protein [Nocardia carnea]
MTAEKYSDEWLRAVAAADREVDRLDLVDDVLFDMFHAATAVQSRKGYRDCSAEEAKYEHYRGVIDSVWEDRYAAMDRKTDVQFGREFTEAQQRRREEHLREHAPRWERSR